MAKIIHIKKIPNLPFPNENVKRQINLLGVSVDGIEDTITLPYYISYIENNIDVSSDFEKQGKPMKWTNDVLVYRRDLQGNILVNPAYTEAEAGNQLPPTIPNPDYVDEETTPELEPTITNPDYISSYELGLIPQYLTAPAFDYFVELFHEYPAIFWDFLDMYIDENYGEGWYGSQGRNVVDRR